MEHTSNKAYKRVKQRPFNAIKTDTIILQKCTFVYVHKYIYSTATVLQKKVMICTKNISKIKQNIPINIKRYIKHIINLLQMILNKQVLVQKFQRRRYSSFFFEIQKMLKSQ